MSYSKKGRKIVIREDSINAGQNCRVRINNHSRNMILVSGYCIIKLTKNSGDFVFEHSYNHLLLIACAKFVGEKFVRIHRLKVAI